MLPKYAALFEQPMRVTGGENVRMTGYNGSFTISAEAAAVVEDVVEEVAEFRGAWYPSPAGSELIDLTPGSVSDGVTTFTPNVTGISVHASSLNYVYLECDITVATTGGYVTGAVITTAIVKSYTTTKTSTNTKAYLLLCTWQAGFTVARYRYYSHGYMAIDDGTNTGTAAHYFLGS